MRDEIFGPILPILTYRTLDETLGRIAATPSKAPTPSDWLKLPIVEMTKFPLHTVEPRDRSRDRAWTSSGGAVEMLLGQTFVSSSPFGLRKIWCSSPYLMHHANASGSCSLRHERREHRGLALCSAHRIGHGAGIAAGAV